MLRSIQGIIGTIFLSSTLSACAVQTDPYPVSAIGPTAPAVFTSGNVELPSVVQPVRFIPYSGQVAAIPAGYVSFCMRNADQCQAKPGDSSSVDLTPEIWKQMVAVNHDVNDRIWPEEDQQHYGRAEYWTIPTDGYGDCEDMALAKRQQLIKAGLPEPALRIAVVVTPRQVRHAVLTVVTNAGDYVLDNLTANVRSWDQTDYRWIERQDPSQGWVGIDRNLTILARANPDLTTTGQTR